METASFPDLIFHNADRYVNRPAFRVFRDGRWRDVTWADFAADVRRVAAGLLDLRLLAGERVGIVSNTRYEWMLADIAILSAAGVTVGVYPSLTGPQAQYILEHAEARFAFVEDREQLAKVRAVKGNLPDLERIIVFDPVGVESDDLVTTLETVRERGRAGEEKWHTEQESRVKGLSRDTMATIIYTSGTTGPPKGGVLTHGNFLAACQAFAVACPTSTEDLALSFLPLAHIYQRAVDYKYLYDGTPIAYARSMDTIAEDMQAVRPTVAVAVPRVFEKMHARVLARVEEGSKFRQRTFSRAMEVGREVSRLKQEGKPIPPKLARRFKLANALVFKKLKKHLGGRITRMISGAAPLSRSIAEFFHAADLLILEGYGLTETTAASTVNRQEDYRFGTVGKVVPGVEIKIAEDGEILMRGDVVFQGYFKDQQATAEALREGWLHTGDVGVLDERGFLTITDRKKDIIITAGGKNVAPQNIENLLKTNRLISQAMVYGDRRPYLTALITLDPEELGRLAEAQEMGRLSPGALVKDDRIIGAVQKVVDQVNADLASYETIKKFHVLEKDFSIEAGDLTPTMKVRRQEVLAQYGDLLEALYQS